jgi:regulator of protease activity HflC (stomatin/prohibitin superfamily)
LIFIVILGIGAALGYTAYIVSTNAKSIWIVACATVLAYIVSSAIQVADQWSRAVVLRLGKFHALRGPGLFLIIPLIDTILYWIYTCVLTSSFNAEKTLTKDTLHVLFWNREQYGIA